jgi:thiol-disulfide isomerase/thioredoxin
MRIRAIHIFSILISFWSVSCDVITPPYTRSVAPDTTQPDTGMVRYHKVLIEEFTGAQCTNCPIGHRKLAELAAVYGDSIVIVSIHAGEFARPNASKGYPTDFRTPAGEELNTRFRVFAYPAAVIDRSKIDGTSYVVGVQNWGSAIARQLRGSTPLAIETQALADTLSGQLTIRVRLQSLVPIDYPLNIGYYILEDSVVAPQLDNGTYVPDYIHRHVLRDAPLGAYGEALISAQTPAGTTITRTYTYNLGQVAWNLRHLEVVVFITRPEPDYTVVQCQKSHVAFGQN